MNIDQHHSTAQLDLIRLNQVNMRMATCMQYEPYKLETLILTATIGLKILQTKT